MTSLGKEFLEREGNKVGSDELSKLNEIIEEFKTYIKSLDSTAEIVIRGMRALRSRRRRRR